ncbi:hypothetical protein KC19_4G144800 [Ceratodon purpureus]|uniref:Uncharacterized protein n=1 Tax=Ceratodon purpureus TaxID=3225 RepID=A0A8T0I8M2_CERPU|nr:hypothetical protein KC19_4G144800 [Ceratodon purpureus]
MGMRPESMERWGIVGIFKEAATLLRKHYRLFMPFFLAFHLPASFLAVFQNVFLVASGPPFHHTNFVNGAYSTAHKRAEVDTDNQPSFVLSYTFLLLIFIFSTFAVAAFAYIVEYVYSKVDTASDDDSITKKVLKLLPHAFLRMFVTQIWITLVLVLLVIACAIFAAILSAILSALVGGTSGPTPAFYVFFFLPMVIGTVAVMVMFALAQFVAVLEKEKYGRLALKQSTMYARGRAGTIFGIVLFGEIIGFSIVFPAQAVANAGLSLWIKIIVASILSILFSVVSAYVGLVGIVMYFVCKSNSEAVLPEFQRGSNIPAVENPYKPVVYGTSQPETVGVP